MLKKIVVLAGVLGSMATLAAVGCSSSSSGATGAGSDASSGSDSGRRGRDGGSSSTTGDGGVVLTRPDGGFTSDGGPISLDDGGTITAPACYNLGGAVVIQTGVNAPAAHQNKCNSTQISGYMTACLSGGTQADCDNFYAANGACATCIGGPISADAGVFDYPATIPIDSSGDVVANSSGCIAALSSGDATCKLTFNQLAECEQSACSTCSTDPDNTACLDYADADTGGCAGSFAVDSTCTTAVNTSESNTTNQTACGIGAADFATAYNAVATTMCGP